MVRGAGRQPFASIEQPEAEDVIDRGDAILPSNLLPLGIGPAMIGDRDLIDAAVKLRHLHGQLRLDAEPIRHEAKVLEHFGSEDLVPDLHIAQVQIRDNVAEGGQEPIPKGVPEVENAMRTAMESVPEDNVGMAFEDGLEQPRIVLWIILQGGILNDDDIAGHAGDRGADGCSLSAIARMDEEANLILVVAAQALQDLSGAVNGGVIHQDDLFLIGSRLHPLEDELNGVALVIDWNDHGELHLDHCISGQLRD